MAHARSSQPLVHFHPTDNREDYRQGRQLQISRHDNRWEHQIGTARDYLRISIPGTTPHSLTGRFSHSDHLDQQGTDRFIMVWAPLVHSTIYLHRSVGLAGPRIRQVWHGIAHTNSVPQKPGSHSRSCADVRCPRALVFSRPLPRYLPVRNSNRNRFRSPSS